MKYSEFKFCPRCKTELVNKKCELLCPECGAIIYKNSAPTASVLIVKNDKVLLAKRGVVPFKGEYDTVGGFLKHGEDPKKGALREVEEETGLKIKIIDFLGIYIDTYGAGGEKTLNINYVGKIIGGKMKPQDDVAALEWFPITKLPKPAFKGEIKAFDNLLKWFNSGRGGQN